MYLGGNRRWVPLIRPCRTREGAWDGRFYNAKFIPLDPRIRTTTSTIVDFVAYSQKVDIRKASLYFFSSIKLALLSLLKELKPSPDSKMIKLLTFDNLFLPLRFSLKLVVVVVE